MVERVKPIRFDEAVAALLQAECLPTADLDGRPVALYGVRIGDRLYGVIGLEPCGPVGLLRSLTVAADRRRSGLGAKLVAHAEREALRAGCKELYLLTTTAEGYFARLGYRLIAREKVPAAIASTTQFSSLCPSSSVVMTKELGLEAKGPPR